MMSRSSSKPGEDALSQFLGDAGIVERESMRLLEEVVGRVFRFRRHGLTSEELSCVDAFPFRSARPGGCAP